MKYLYAVVFLSVVIGASPATAQEYEFVENFDIGEWSVTIQKRPTSGQSGTSESNIPMFSLRKQNDQEPDVLLIKCPDDLADDTTLKTLIDYVNLIVDHYNHDQIDELDKTLTDKWEEGKGWLQYRYAKYIPSSTILYSKDNETEKTVPVAILTTSNFNVGPPHGPRPEIEDGGTGDRIGYMSVFFVVIAGGKVQSAGGYFPLINEEYCVLLSRTSSGGFACYTLSYKDWPEEGYDKPTPFYRWDRDGKILNRETKRLKFEDFDIMTFLSGKPHLRGY